MVNYLQPRARIPLRERTLSVTSFYHRWSARNDSTKIFSFSEARRQFVPRHSEGNEMNFAVNRGPLLCGESRKSSPVASMKNLSEGLGFPFVRHGFTLDSILVDFHGENRANGKTGEPVTEDREILRFNFPPRRKWLATGKKLGGNFRVSPLSLRFFPFFPIFFYPRFFTVFRRAFDDLQTQRRCEIRAAKRSTPASNSSAGSFLPAASLRCTRFFP